MLTNLFRPRIFPLFHVSLAKRTFADACNKHYDVVITGGGMIGTSLACALGKNSKLAEKRILVLEGSSKTPWQSDKKYSNRVSSINPSSKKLFFDIGAWKFIENNRFGAVKELRVWDALSDATISFGDSDSTDTVSYIIENDLIVAAMAEEMKQCENVNVLYNAKVTKYNLPDYEGNTVQIKLQNGDVYTCDLLLGCDGAQSSVRKEMQTDYVSWSYHQMGVVATLNLCETSTNNIAWQRFLPNGPVAVLPLTDKLSSLVWSTTPDQARELLSLSEDEFVQRLNKSLLVKSQSPGFVQQATGLFDTALRMLNCGKDKCKSAPPKIESIETNSRAAFPLGFGHSSQYIGKGVALVGDAAHRIHPLAGQGVNLGFGDVACLTETLADAVYNGSTINDLTYLRNYESERQKHNVVTMAGIEALHRLYTTNSTPIVLLRSLGLQATNALEPLKRLIISHAS